MEAWLDLPLALEITADPAFDLAQQCLYLEACFETAMVIRKYEIAKAALRKLPAVIPSNLERQRWRNRRWPKWLAELILRDEVQVWLDIVEEFGQTHPFFGHAMNLQHDLIWVRMFEVLLFADRLVDAVKVLAAVARFKASLSDGYFAFERYFQHLHSRRRWDDMQLLLDCIDGPGSPFSFLHTQRFRIGSFSRLPFAELALHQGDRARAELNCSLVIVDVRRKLQYCAEGSRARTRLMQEAEAAQKLLAHIYATDRPVCAQYFAGQPSVL